LAPLARERLPIENISQVLDELAQKALNDYAKSGYRKIAKKKGPEIMALVIYGPEARIKGLFE
jgi:hypothetical protein